MLLIFHYLDMILNSKVKFYKTQNVPASEQEPYPTLPTSKKKIFPDSQIIFMCNIFLQTQKRCIVFERGQIYCLILSIMKFDLHIKFH